MKLLPRSSQKDHDHLINALDPPPLIDQQRNLCLLFSNKAGCTTLTKWFFGQIGELEQANDYHRWIHRYRIEVYLQRDGYADALRAIANPTMHRVKLVRSPYTRAVSSYLHAIRTSYAEYDLSEFLGRAVNAVAGFSFSEFVDYLANRDLTRCNPHIRQQCTQAESDGAIAIDRLMRLESLSADLAALESDLGLPPSNLKALSRSPHHNRRSTRDREFCGDRIFTRHTESFPDYRCFYNEALRSTVQGVYARDFSQYHYDTNSL